MLSGMSRGAVRGVENSSRHTGQVVDRKVWESMAVVCSCLSRSRSCLHAATSWRRRQLTLQSMCSACMDHKYKQKAISARLSTPARLEKHKDHAKKQHPDGKVPQPLGNVKVRCRSQLRAHCSHTEQDRLRHVPCGHLLRDCSGNGRGCAVGQAAFSAATGHDGGTLIAGSNEEECAAVAGIAAHVPCVEEPVGKFLGGLVGAAAEVEAVEEGHGDLEALGSPGGVLGAGGGCIGWVGEADGAEEGADLLQAAGGE